MTMNLSSTQVGIDGIAIGAANAVGALVTNWVERDHGIEVQFDLNTTDNVDILDILTNIDARVFGQRITVERFPGTITSVIIENPVITMDALGQCMKVEDKELMNGLNQITEINVHELGAVTPLQITAKFAIQEFGKGPWINSEE